MGSRLRLHAIGLVLGLVVAACGGGDEAAPSSTRSAAAESETVLVADAGDARLTLPPGVDEEVTFEEDVSFADDPDVLIAFDLQPDGLELNTPAVLEATLTAEQAADGVFAASIDDEGVEPLVIDSIETGDDGSVRLGVLVEHFSGFTLNRFTAYTGARFEMQAANEVDVDAPFNARVKMEPPEIGYVGTIPLSNRYLTAENTMKVEGGPWFITGDFTVTPPLSPPGRLADRPARTGITEEEFEIIETFSCTQKAEDVSLRYGAIMQFPVSNPERGDFLFNSYVPMGVLIDCVEPKAPTSVGSAFSETMATPTLVRVQPLDGSSVAESELDGEISLSLAATDGGYLAAFVQADPGILERLCAIEFDMLDAQGALVDDYALAFPGAIPGVNCPTWPFEPPETVLSLPAAPSNPTGVGLQTDFHVSEDQDLSVWTYESLDDGTTRVVNFKVSMTFVIAADRLPPLTFERRAEDDDRWLIVEVTPRVIAGWEGDG